MNVAMCPSCKYPLDTTQHAERCLPRPASDLVNPAHYTRLRPEPIDVIAAWGLGFDLGNVIKYCARAGHKPGADAAADLAKAQRYLEHAIAALVKA